MSAGLKEALEKELQASLHGGFLGDVVEVKLEDVKSPESIAAWSHLPIKLYRSETTTRILRKQLDATVPGIPATYNEILQAIMDEPQVESFCFLLGGQIRDILRGKISQDVDFSYACTAQQVATICVNRKWTVKYKAIGPVSEPNYVLIGDEQSELYMEGFSLSFNALSECYEQDFRQNLLFYDLSNDLILDKSGFGLEDIKGNTLRLSCAPEKCFEDWAAADFTTGQKSLRYVKFIIRARMEGSPLKTDQEELDFVVLSLSNAFRDNAEGLSKFWVGYVLSGALKSREGVRCLLGWVEEVGGSGFLQKWLPILRAASVDPAWLGEASQEASPGTGSGGAAMQLGRRPTKDVLYEMSAEQTANSFHQLQALFHGHLGTDCLSESWLRHLLTELGLQWTDQEFRQVLGELPPHAIKPGAGDVDVEALLRWSMRPLA